jgi:CRISPR system Cascade subunit CasE
MYLSRLTLNPRNAQVRAELAHPYELHRTLLRAFPPGSVHKPRDDDGAAGILFRVDESLREHKITVLVQSHLAPDWSFLNAEHDARGHTYLLCPPESKAFDLKFAVGQRLAFRLRANPTRRLGKSAGERQGKRVGILKEEEQLEWLRRKADAGGFRIIRVLISREERIVDSPGAKPARPALEWFAVQFDGILQVVNVDAFVRTLRGGIGSGKAFGFGLLSLAPV